MPDDYNPDDFKISCIPAATIGKLDRFLLEQRYGNNLSMEQNNVLYAVVDNGQNVFCTGSADKYSSCLRTGKTWLLLRMIALLCKKHGKEKVAITATTGIAASHINGQMIHSFAGISNGAKSIGELTSNIMKNATVQD
ncbi:hypothetical protein BC938DRAFT_472571 [Jimgerdemannia flammicorona]|uniref:ATP-dependent DNA helicase n=1 Tax=Jimgerdemannia flammicorona TaxID=994334 RepID=A0A433QZZ1_9FUNG|nr:hypothetical protein BC938DRAFT_472571 [Jimgerdemannia flammicorona]